jgi:hypothetical protein
MYKEQNTPLVSAATPGVVSEPMAANEGFGAFGSAW